MEQINPYAVMRNTATNEAYKAYSRKASMVGQPYLLIGTFLSVLAPQMLLFGGRWLQHKSPLDWRWVLGSLALSAALSALFFGIGLVKMLRFRRDHPIPDEWRQVPRVRPSLISVRKPQRP